MAWGRRGDLETEAHQRQIEEDAIPGAFPGAAGVARQGWREDRGGTVGDESLSTGLEKGVTTAHQTESGIGFDVVPGSCCGASPAATEDDGTGPFTALGHPQLGVRECHVPLLVGGLWCAA